ncbi:hypothetical protein HDU92_001000 [Lobulomyces angularis]|nr:hypothetical protein HDU92_001000 [Lobulomyces angularis]
MFAENLKEDAKVATINQASREKRREKLKKSQELNIPSTTYKPSQYTTSNKIPTASNHSSSSTTCTSYSKDAYQSLKDRKQIKNEITSPMCKYLNYKAESSNVNSSNANSLTSSSSIISSKKVIPTNFFNTKTEKSSPFSGLLKTRKSSVDNTNTILSNVKDSDLVYLPKNYSVVKMENGQQQIKPVPPSKQKSNSSISRRASVPYLPNSNLLEMNLISKKNIINIPKAIDTSRFKFKEVSISPYYSPTTAVNEKPKTTTSFFKYSKNKDAENTFSPISPLTAVNEKFSSLKVDATTSISNNENRIIHPEIKDLLKLDYFFNLKEIRNLLKLS